jgi:rSAM/selenodomain-associated transferase 2
MFSLSIIIPTLQESAKIEQLVRYLFENMGEAEIEVLVVDGGSSDDTAARALEAGATVLQSPRTGRATQMNHGAKMAQHEVLYFVHADTIPPATYTSDIEAALQIPGIRMGCYRYRFDSDSLLLRFNAWFVRFPFLWCQGGDKTFFIERGLFQDFGGYDERYVVMEEYDFLRRIMPGHKLYIIPKNALVSARKYEKNSWLRVQLANIAAFSMFRRGKPPEQIKQFYKSFLHW